jgi:VanZ family protein
MPACTRSTAGALGIAPWTFLAAPLPRYWTGFDVAANLLGYGPLGFLLALSALRTSPRLPAVLLATLGGGLLSLVMESLQTYLPMRVASNVDLLLNLAGAWLGALMAFALEKAGAIARWSRFRERWFAAHSRGALVLLALWPVALLFPASVPLGLGQVLERAEDALAAWLAETPFPAMGAGARFRAGAVVARRGTAVRDAGRADSVPAGVLHRPLGRPARGAGGVRHRCRGGRLGAFGRAELWAVPRLGVADPAGAVRPRNRVGGGAAAGGVPRRACAALTLLALVLHLSLLNNAPIGAYFAQTLQVWEQGRFIRFHGLAQWLGWLWPYAALVYVLLRLSGRDAEN